MHCDVMDEQSLKSVISYRLLESTRVKLADSVKLPSHIDHIFGLKSLVNP